ncbi:hypothetical protein EB796_012553 [Bugula neritina]|uniref:ABC transporter domain-containing protein n=1 Tax=Bugula neritina TaxID=10212 RepID=A0A7J7JUY8_BUGNE|nr:hypothetical protein EB796_012553 [Bugula neritina]
MEQDSELHVFIPTPDQLESCPKSPAKHYLSASYELKFTDLCVKIDKREILKDVYGVAKPGEMVAIMGPSGAGKTTLLNCLAGRRPIESGTLTLNSRSITKQLKRKISYVLQQDIFIEDLTCWETLWFTALLRLPGSMPRAEKKQRIMELVDALDMEKCLHTKIGNTDVRGLSGGEKKRTTIACELLTNPALMLLDEPTSGLDSSNAFSLCNTLKKFAKDSGKILIASIHQPSSQIFNMFDKLLLLCDGKMAYFGEVKNCAQHFASLELPCPANYNLADHILDQVKGAQDVRDTIVKGATQHRWDNSTTQTLVMLFIEILYYLLASCVVS